MERLSKIVVLAWTSAAIGVEIWLLSSSWPGLPLVALAVAALAFGLGARYRSAVAVPLVLSYIFPVIVRAAHGGAHYAPHEAIWMAALVGVMAPDAFTTSWHIPPVWRVPLVTAALMIVVSSPVVALREIDLNPGLLSDLHGWNWGGAVWPRLVVTWTLHTSLTLVVGVLWFDWLIGARGLDTHRYVLTPLVISGLMLAAVSIYQLFVDLSFLNDTVFGSIGRASGTMFDANVSGALAAMSIGAAYIWARRFGRSWPALAVAAGVANWLAVWASGSRTAFAAAAIVTAFIAASLLVEHGVSRARILAVGGAAVVVAAALAAGVGMARPQVVGPLGRVWATLPSPTMASFRHFGVEMWNRNGYGTAATAMIRDSPVFGVGVGTYHTIAADYVPGGTLPPDNAQNWIRHQVVELGALGSLGWIVWFVAFAVFVVRARRGDPAIAWVTRGVLIAFGGISMLGMPGQDVMVAVTFWSVAFWHVSLVAAPARDRPVPRWMWAAAAAAVVAVGAGTTDLAVTRLRMPARAVAATWPFSYGVSNAAGGDDGYRHARAHVVAVVDAPYRWMVVSVRLDPATADDPVDVRVWTDGATLLKGRLSGVAPLTAVVELPGASGRVLFEAAARRAGSRLPFFVRDVDPSFLVKWEFLERPPAHINGYPRSLSS